MDRRELGILTFVLLWVSPCDPQELSPAQPGKLGGGLKWTTNHTTGGDRPQKVVIVRTELRAFLFFFSFPPHFQPSTPPPTDPLHFVCSKAGGPRGVGEANMLHLVQYSGIHHTHTPPSFTAPSPLLPLPQVLVSAKCKRRATCYRDLQSINQ